MDAAPTARSLVVFDFDWSLIDEDSDHFTLEVLSPGHRAKMDELKGAMQWTDLMHHLYSDLITVGVTQQRIAEVLGTLPLQPAMVAGLHHVKDHGQADIAIVSDANTFFIEETLKSKNVRHLITHIITNPAHFDSDGRMHIHRHIRADIHPPHGCTRGTCSINICKGKEVRKLMQGECVYETVVYVGDGRNDFCPCWELRSTDHVLARKGRYLERMLLAHRQAVEDKSLAASAPALLPNVHYWSEAGDVLVLFQNIFPTRNITNMQQ